MNEHSVNNFFHFFPLLSERQEEKRILVGKTIRFRTRLVSPRSRWKH